MDIRTEIDTPTLMIDSNKVIGNITFMAGKALVHGVRFRPHFKTHQSAAVGEWFRSSGVSAITVSSIEMGRYFAGCGWQDILIAFPLNLRQLAAVRNLAQFIHLGVLLESEEAVVGLSNELDQPVDVWIEIDTGSGRTGCKWQAVERIVDLLRTITRRKNLRLRGLLTHAGITYSARSVEEIVQVYKESCARMNGLRAELALAGYPNLEVSVGDTPGCTLSSNLGQVDEIRPGNFVFYDAQMLSLGVCRAEQVGAVVACPVVALYPQRNEAVVYGGAVHLSKDTVEIEGRITYGQVVDLFAQGWGAPLAGAYVARLSQEHGVLHLPSPVFERLKIGDLVGILPAHICLVVSALGMYRTLKGEKILTFARA